MKKYYCKCGFTFEKSSTAGVTRYEAFDAPGCQGCKYKEHTSVYREGKSHGITFCQAGCKPLNHHTNISTSNEKNASQITVISLDLQILKTIGDYAKDLPGCTSTTGGHFLSLDKEDGRKNLIIMFESNKKGLAAKQAIYKRFFPDGREFQAPVDDQTVIQDVAPVEDVPKPPKKTELQTRNVTKIGVKFRDYFYDADFLKDLWKGNVQIRIAEGTPEKLEIYSMGYEFLGYAPKGMHEKERFVKPAKAQGVKLVEKKQQQAAQDVPVPDKDHSQPVDFYPYNSGRLPHCPYFSSYGDDSICCNMCFKKWNRKEFTSANESSVYYDTYCFKDFDQCESYQELFREEMASDDKVIISHRVCESCCNNSGYTGLKEHHGQTHCFCQLFGKEMERNKPELACKWYNKRYRISLEVSTGYETFIIPAENGEIFREDTFKCDQQDCPFHEAEGPACSYDCKDADREGDDSFLDDLKEAVKEYECKNSTVLDAYMEASKTDSNDSACTQDCPNIRDGKCSIEGVSGSALKFFAVDQKAPDCRNMKILKTRYLKDIKRCNHAHTDCTAIGHECAIKKEYCCYACAEPCNDRCVYSKELVPFGKLNPEDKGPAIVEPASIYSMPIDNTDDQSVALNGHLQYIRKKSEDIVGNYVEIGFVLVSIRDNKLYQACGYDTLIDCVEAELNMKKSTAYNLIKIAEKFGDPNTKKLKPEYGQFNYVQCLEMSTMTKEELVQAKPEMSKREMQQLKASNRLEKQEEPVNIEIPMIVPPAASGDAGSGIIDVTSYSIVQTAASQEFPEQMDPIAAGSVIQDEDTFITEKKDQEPVTDEEMENAMIRAAISPKKISQLAERKNDMKGIINDTKKRYKGIKVEELNNHDAQLYLKAVGFLNCLEEVLELFGIKID